MNQPHTETVAPAPRLLVRAPEAAEICGISESAWHRLNAAGKTPQPIKLTGAVVWSVPELTDWVAAGCPNRATWTALRSDRQ